jgi:hypothetical protein
MMKKYRPLLAAPAALFLAACAGLPDDAPAAPAAAPVVVTAPADLVAVTTGNQLVSFNHASPGTLETAVEISGLRSGESVVGIDFRPANGLLYGLGSSGELYQLDLRSGAATPKAALSTALNGTSFGLSFNPVDGQLRVVSDAGQNLSVDADSGVARADAPFDAAKASIVAAAYTTVPNGPFQTTLYVLNSNKAGEIDSALAPHSGKLLTVGALSAPIGKPAGFDISGNESSGVAYAATVAADAAASTLYQVKLGAGSTKSLGAIGAKDKVCGLAIKPGV